MVDTSLHPAFRWWDETTTRLGLGYSGDRCRDSWASYIGLPGNSAGWAPHDPRHPRIATYQYPNGQPSTFRSPNTTREVAEQMPDEFAKWAALVRLGLWEVRQR